MDDDEAFNGDGDDGQEAYVEYRAFWTAKNDLEAEALLEEVMDAVIDVICPTGEGPRTVCSNCNGTLVNPDEEYGTSEDEEYDEDEDIYRPGAPCWICVDSEQPGTQTQCVRDHVEGGTIWPDGQWFDGEDRRKREFCATLLSAWEEKGPESVRSLLKETYADLTLHLEM